MERSKLRHSSLDSDTDTMVPLSQDRNRERHGKQLIKFNCNCKTWTKLEIFTSFCLYLEVLTWGIFHGIIGPTLLDLELKTNTTTTQVSLFISITFTGFLVGVLVGGFIYDRVNPRLFMSTALAGLALLLVFIPRTTNFTTLIITGVVTGLFAGGVDIGHNVLSVAVWKHHGAVFIQSFHAVFAVGTFLASLIPEPFLAYPLKTHNNESHDHSNSTVHMLTTTVVYDVTVNYSIEAGSEGKAWSESQVEYAYLVASLCLITSSATFLACFIYERKTTSKKHEAIVKKEDDDDDATENVKKEKPLSVGDFNKTYLCIMFPLMFLRHATDVALEITFPNLIMVFAVQGLQWSKPAGLNLTVVLRICYAASRVSAIFFSFFISPNKILIMDMILMSVAFTAMVSALHLHPLVLWVSTGLAGFGMASIYGSSISWACQHIPITGRSGIFLVGGNWSGVLTFPALCGFLFDRIGPMAFIHACFADVCIWTLMFILSNIVVYKWGPGKYKDNRDSTKDVALESLNQTG